MTTSMKNIRENVIVSRDEMLIANACKKLGVTYVIAKTGDHLQSDAEKVALKEQANARPVYQVH